MITLIELTNILTYNFITGVFIWKIKPSKKVNKGDIAGCLSARDNRRIVRINGVNYLASRLAWLYITHKEPEQCIDHINGNSSHDMFINLRDVSKGKNNKNRQLHHNNISGKQGVRWDKQNNKWATQINVNGKKKHLGFYCNLTEAIKAREQAETDNDYHINHGRSKT